MASNIFPNEVAPISIEIAPARRIGIAADLKKLVMPLASLKFTVALFAMSIFIVLAGTLAQTDKGIWLVMDQYFRVPIWPTLGFARIDFQTFFPPAFFPGKHPLTVPGYFYFPGGWLIGGMLAINLLAAHGLRFKLQARSSRLYLGLAVLLLGVLTTWLVIVSGSNKDGLQTEALITWSSLWKMFLAGLALVWLAGLYALVQIDRRQRITRWILAIGCMILTGVLGYLLVNTIREGGEVARFADPSMRILWQLIKGLLAGFVLLAGCVLLFRKRAGIVLLHGGVGLMMLSEVLVGTSAVEGQMWIQQGTSSNFVRDIRKLELTVIDPSDKEVDDVVAIPESYLHQGGTISNPSLPFDIRIVKFLKNSELRALKSDEASLADRGTGTELTADERPPVSGLDSSGAFDSSAVYATFLDKQDGTPLGTYLVTLFFSETDLLLSKPYKLPIPETVTADGKDWQVFLRFQRTYKPYTIHLEDVRKDDYVGTDTPMNYSSDVHLVDDARHVDWKTRIWMNNPLRYAGETFYQSGFNRDDSSGAKMTTLQVVTNSGWMVPYVGCMIVLVGMATHFLIGLVTFLTRTATLPDETDSANVSQVGRRDQGSHRPAAARRPKLERQAELAPRRPGLLTRILLPLVVVALCAIWVGGKARVPVANEGEINLYEFGKLPIASEGRVKPIDTLARNSLRMISDRQTFIDADGNRQPAIRWLLDVIAAPQAAVSQKVFVIKNPEVLNTLGLQRRASGTYALEEFVAKLGDVAEQARQARALDASQLTVYQRKVLELERKIGVLDLLVRAFSPPDIRAETVHDDLMDAIKGQQALKERHPPLAIPPMVEGEQWETYATVWLKNLLASAGGKSVQPAAVALAKILAAYGDGDAARFNAKVGEYQEILKKAEGPAKIHPSRVSYEAFFNNLQPFYLAMPLYIFAFVLTALSWLFAHTSWGQLLRSTGFWLIVFTFAVHTFALVSRMYISGRPPVTNLYSSAVFIGWGVVVLGMVFESIFRLGIGNTLSAMAGFFALGIAHFLSGDGDTFTVLQAVLDTQFWLSTHVVCVTLGYATTFAAGHLGVGYILLGLCSPYLSTRVGRKFGSMIHGTLCFAILFSFVGTVLGGLWADDSWGRFWGWDPKENGALIIVLWNALVLHARWGGLVKERGTALLAVGGNIVTGWSWFGVNELGVGLHSYGFTEGVLLSLGIYVATQLAIIAAGSQPQERWWSFRRRRLEASAGG